MKRRPAKRRWFARRETFSPDPTIQKSLRHSIYDGVAYSVMTGGGESYFSAYALLLRATTPQIGALASVPPLLASWMQLVSAWVGRRTGQRRNIIVFGALVQASALIPIIVLPAVFPDYAVELLLVCAVLYFSGPNLASPQWGSLMGDLVPENRRGRFFGLRTRFASLTGFTSLIVGGLTLHAFDTAGVAYWGFVAIFSAACLARLVSAYHLSRIYDPPGHVAALETPWHTDVWKRMRSSPLVRFSIFYACMQIAVAIASPFYVVYMLRDLQFTYLEFMLNTSASVFMQFLTLNRWGRVSDLFGNRLIMVTTGSMVLLLPLLWIVSTDFWYLLAVQALSGFMWAGFSLSTTTFVFDLTPPARRATLMATHNTLAAFGVFVGAMIGGYLGTHLPREMTLFGDGHQWMTALYGVFAISALARLIVALLFLPRLREVRRVRPMSMSGLIFRVTRFHPVSGLIFDIVGTRRKARNRRPDEHSD
ncbi:MAG: MFS transporter [Gammaproteobacteria bacterium]|nr:MFS transporter [Gammaproteobacteria bacterium]